MIKQLNVSHGLKLNCLNVKFGEGAKSWKYVESVRTCHRSFAWVASLQKLLGNFIKSQSAIIKTKTATRQESPVESLPHWVSLMEWSSWPWRAHWSGISGKIEYQEGRFDCTWYETIDQWNSMFNDDEKEVQIWQDHLWCTYFGDVPRPPVGWFLSQEKPLKARLLSCHAPYDDDE